MATMVHNDAVYRASDGSLCERYTRVVKGCWVRTMGREVLVDRVDESRLRAWGSTAVFDFEFAFDYDTGYWRCVSLSLQVPTENEDTHA